MRVSGSGRSVVAAALLAVCVASVDVTAASARDRPSGTAGPGAEYRRTAIRVDAGAVETVPGMQNLDSSDLAAGDTTITFSDYKGSWIERPDGVRIGLRNVSQTGGRAIDVRYPDGTTRTVHIQ